MKGFKEISISARYRLGNPFNTFAWNSDRSCTHVCHLIPRPRGNPMERRKGKQRGRGRLCAVCKKAPNMKLSIISEPTFRNLVGKSFSRVLSSFCKL